MCYCAVCSSKFHSKCCNLRSLSIWMRSEKSLGRGGYWSIFCRELAACLVTGKKLSCSHSYLLAARYLLDRSVKSTCIDLNHRTTGAIEKDGCGLHDAPPASVGRRALLPSCTATEGILGCHANSCSTGPGWAARKRKLKKAIFLSCAYDLFKKNKQFCYF